MSRVAEALLLTVALAMAAWSGAGVRTTTSVGIDAVAHVDGYAYSVVLPSMATWIRKRDYDSADHPHRSSLVLLENGQPLGPAHSSREDIRALGAGRYLHSPDALTFSTRDNSDPGTNGRSYQATYKWRLSWLISGPVLILVLWRQRRALVAIRQRLIGVFELRGLLPNGTRDSAVGPAFVSAYLAVYLAAVAVGSVWWGLDSYYEPRAAAGGNQTLPNRMAYYKDNRDAFDLVFLGDSRTYCGVHPERIDPLLGSHSINLSSFSNWFPTQYAEVLELAELVPPATTVVLTIGHQNFTCFGDIQRVFPIKVPTALRYTAMGIPRVGLWDNVGFYNRYLHFWAVRGEIREQFLTWARATSPWTQEHLAARVASALLETKASAAPTPAGPTTDAAPDAWLTPPANPLIVTANIRTRPALSPDVGAIVRRYASDPNATMVDVTDDGGRITSVVVYYRGGGYYRIEVDHAFFRSKQNGNRPSNVAVSASADPQPPIDVPPPASACLELFDRILDLFQQHHITLIVNEIEEAPYTYGSAAVRQAYREAMQRRVRPLVEAHGFRYVTTPLERLEDADYFDYNHLNSQGIEKYSPMLAAALRPLLAEPASGAR